MLDRMANWVCRNVFKKLRPTECYLLEYWLSSLKVATIVIFIILGIVVNAGGNTDHEYIGGKYWTIPGAPFVGGFGGFARVFVTASFACESQRQPQLKNNCSRLSDGGTESLGITAGETKNPSKNMPRVVKFVFWRYACGGSSESSLTFSKNRVVLYFEHFAHWFGWRVPVFAPVSSFLSDFTVPWDYPNLSNKTTSTSPFTIVFEKVGSSVYFSAYSG
jgi:AAT family amino acid transporter